MLYLITTWNSISESWLVLVFSQITIISKVCWFYMIQQKVGKNPMQYDKNFEEDLINQVFDTKHRSPYTYMYVELGYFLWPFSIRARTRLWRKLSRVLNKNVIWFSLEKRWKPFSRHCRTFGGLVSIHCINMYRFFWSTIIFLKCKLVKVSDESSVRCAYFVFLFFSFS